MNRDTLISEVQMLAKKLKKDIPIIKFKRNPIVQDDIVYAYRSLVPTSIPGDKGFNQQVEIGDWIVIHYDGRQEIYNEEDLTRDFKVVEVDK